MSRSGEFEVDCEAGGRLWNLRGEAALEESRDRAYPGVSSLDAVSAIEFSELAYFDDALDDHVAVDVRSLDPLERALLESIAAEHCRDLYRRGVFS